MTKDEIIEIGARAHFNAAGRVRYGGAAPDWNQHLTERNREQGRAEFRELLSQLSEAGLAFVPVTPNALIAQAGSGFIEHPDEGHRLMNAGYAYRAMVRAAQES